MWVKIAAFFATIFGEDVLKIITLVPGQDPARLPGLRADLRRQRRHLRVRLHGPHGQPRRSRGSHLRVQERLRYSDAGTQGQGPGLERRGPGSDSMNIHFGQKLFGQFFFLKFWLKFTFLKQQIYIYLSIEDNNLACKVF
jgi:hypothetical protein